MTEPELKKTLQNIVDNGGELFLITNDGCPGCETAKAMFKTEIEDKMITVSNIQKSDDAVTMAAALNIWSVPELVAKYPDRICSIDEATGKEKKCEVAQ